MTNREAFLDALEADLTTARPAPAREKAKPRRKAAALIAAGFAGVAFLASTAGTAVAAPATVESCYDPDHKAFDHIHFCPMGQVLFDYQYTYSPNGGITICYRFTGFISGPCATGSLGPKDSCVHS